MVTIEELLQRVQRLEALVGEHVPVIEADSDQESKRDFVQEIALRPDPEFDASSYRENVDARDDEDADAPDDEQVASLRHRMRMRAAEYWPQARS